jgi:hypothetical protein
MKKLSLLLLTCSYLLAETQEPITVKINKNIASILTTDSNQKIRIQRIQDSNHRLIDDYAKTSRPCPPFCIQPSKVAEGVETLAELEVLKFITNKVNTTQGIIVDARLKSWFELETIPSAINIPFPSVENANPKKVKRIFKLLGMKIRNDGSWDFSHAKEMIVFDNGIWCEQATRFIKGILKFNYPKEKLYYYRSGLQGWQLLGLTTVIHKEIKK